MIKKLTQPEIVYIKIFENKVEVRNCNGNGVTASESDFFSSTRNLVGSFNIAEALVKKTIEKVIKKRLLRKAVFGLIQGIDKSEGGYSEVEERVLRELAFGAGCFNVVVWYGNHLSDEEVIEKYKSK